MLPKGELEVTSALTRIQHRILGMRVANIYDVDKKTYLIKLSKPPNKVQCDTNLNIIAVQPPDHLSGCERSVPR